MALDVQAKDVLGPRTRFGGVLRQLHAAGLAAASDLDLSLDDGHAAALLADGLGGGSSLLRGGGNGAGKNRDTVLLEHVACLVLEEIHEVDSVLCCGNGVRVESNPRPRAGAPPAMG